MATPRELLQRAEQRRQPFAAPRPVHAEPIRTAPAPIAPQPAPVGQSVQQPMGTERVVAPQPIRTNSVYRQLMRSHDRMHTQHLQG